MHKLTITTQIPYREGYNAVNISAIPHYMTVTILKATADSKEVLQQVADDFQARRNTQLTVNIEEVSDADNHS